MEESKKALFREINEKHPKSPMVVLVIIGVIVVIGVVGVDIYFSLFEVIVGLLALAVIASQIAYAYRYYRLIACHDGFRQPFRLIVASTVLLPVMMFVAFGCFRWSWPTELLWGFLLSAVLDCFAVSGYWKAMEAFSRGISDELADAWLAHGRKIRRFAGILLISLVVICVLGFMILTSGISHYANNHTSGWAAFGLIYFILRFALLLGSALGLAVLIFFVKANHADNDMIERTLAELNRGEVESWKLLNP